MSEDSPENPTGSAAQDDEKVLSILERWYSAQDAGETPDLKAWCAGDDELEDRVRQLVQSEEDILRRGRVANRTSDGPDGERLGDFRLMDLLGRGATGEVYLAFQESLNRIVALKVLRRNEDETYAQELRFRREAELAASVEHQNVVPIYGIFEEDGRLLIAMKCLSGPALDQLQARLSPEKVAALGHRLAGALQAVHEAGILHRDLKPANVIFDDDEPILVDFGLARSVKPSGLTREGTVPGTLAYIAPEVLKHGAAARDARSDLYALGATLFELLTGRPPFAFEDQESTIKATLTREAPRIGLKGRWRDLETVVHKSLEKEPSRRYQTAAELALDLGHVVEGLPITARRVGPLGRSARFLARHPGASVAVGLSLSGLLFFGGLYYADRRNADRAAAQDVDAIKSLVHDFDIETARQLHRGLVDRRAGDHRVDDLSVSIESHRALRELMDLLQDPPTAIDPRRLSRLRAEVAEGEGLKKRAATRATALALAALWAGDREDARSRVASIPAEAKGSLKAALLAHLDSGESGITADTRLSGMGRDETLFLLMLSQFEDGNLDCRRRLLQHAVSVAPNDYRVQYAIAVDSVARREHAAALAALQCVKRPHRPHPMRDLLEAYTQMRLGELERARATIEEVDPDFETPIRTSFEARMRLQEGDLPGALKALDAGLEIWPESRRLLLARGRLAYRNREFSTAAGFLDRALAQSSDAHDRIDVQISQLEMRLIESSDPARANEPQTRTGLQALVREVDALLESADRASTSASAYLLKAKILAALGKWQEHEECLQLSLSHPSESVEAAYFYVGRFLQRIFDPYFASAPIAADQRPGDCRIEECLLALDCLDEILEGGTLSESSPHRNQRFQYAWIAAFVASWSGDARRCAQNIERAFEAMEDTEDFPRLAGFRAALETLATKKGVETESRRP